MKLKHTSIYIDPVIIDKLRIYVAEESGRIGTRYSMAWFINQAVVEKMEKDGILKKS